MKLFKTLTYLFIILLLVSIQGCDKNEDPVPEPDTGKITFKFYHYLEGAPLEFDMRKYVNEAGNEYMVNEIQYFISDVTLHRPDGSSYMIMAWKDIHYVDTDIPSTHEWKVMDEIATGDYEKITFTFGINEEKNQSLMFVDHPESLMFWPQYLGGGYHYMKLNGKWLDMNQFERPYDFHLGIGQIYKDQEIIINLVMKVENWFKNPHTYDHNEWGGDIMQKQEAMKLACDNGYDVFEVLGVGF
jgi:hypothetical protein